MIGDASADYRNEQGYILEGPEFLSIFDGATGAALATVDYVPPRHPDTIHPTPEQIDERWGDDYGNRVDRFLACIAYLDGKQPSGNVPGYYTRTVLAAWNWRNGELSWSGYLTATMGHRRTGSMRDRGIMVSALEMWMMTEKTKLSMEAA